MVSGTEGGFGENLILDHYRNYGCNLLLQVGDVWPLGIVPDLALKDEILWIQWLPVDWLGMPQNVINRIKPAHKLISFSKYGEEALRRAGLPNVEKFIWLGLDTKVWKPIPREDLTGVMESMGYSWDSFNLLIVAANQERKGIRQQLEAISIFRKLNPEVDVRLYLHSDLVRERDLRADLNELGLDKIYTGPDPYITTQGGFPEEHMVAAFNCCDVVLNACCEGFGYPQLQAQSVGAPVIVLNEGAGPELTVFGWETPPLGVITSPHQMAQPLPHPAAITACLGEAWRLRKERGVPLRSEKAVKFVRDNFSWDKIAERWIEVIDKCMEDRETHCLDIPSPSEELHKRATTLVEIA